MFAIAMAARNGVKPADDSFYQVFGIREDSGQGMLVPIEDGIGTGAYERNVAFQLKPPPMEKTENPRLRPRFGCERNGGMGKRLREWV